MLHKNDVGCVRRPAPKPCLSRQGLLVALIGSRIVRVVYSDESGVGNLTKEPLTVVTAIVLNVDDQWDSVEASLRVVEMRTPRNLLFKRQLKGSALYRAVRKDDPVAGKILKDILSIPARQKIGIFYGAVDRAGCLRSLKAPKNKSPLTEYNTAFSDCLQRVDTAARIFAAGERVLWIAHRSDSQRQADTTTSHFWHKVFTEVRLDAIPSDAKGLAGWDGSTGVKTSIVDTVYFGNEEKLHRATVGRYLLFYRYPAFA